MTRIGLNIERLRQNLPDTAKAKELLLQFKRELIPEIKGIQHGLARHDIGTVRFHTHRIHSGSLYLGIESVGFPAAELESLIDGGAREDDIQAVWCVLHEACQDYLNQDDDALCALLDESEN